ncbi:unnamed protein product [Pleuronectes platessa]|uniref:Uncharacterized protein n=1 Tax=Pleuronectes platessa TaxID=8262 RepID=A0A9N7YHN9_PLEPL|nr:unnamed protein product [Pleuronectes platessa]
MRIIICRFKCKQAFAPCIASVWSLDELLALQPECRQYAHSPSSLQGTGPDSQADNQPQHRSDNMTFATTDMSAPGFPPWRMQSARSHLVFGPGAGAGAGAAAPYTSSRPGCAVLTAVKHKLQDNNLKCTKDTFTFKRNFIQAVTYRGRKLSNSSCSVLVQLLSRKDLDKMDELREEEDTEDVVSRAQWI